VLIRDTENVLIDTGPGLPVLRELAGQVVIDRVINTHTHPDHTAGNFLFADREILVPEQAVESAGCLRLLSKRFFEEPGVRELWREFVRHTMDFQDQRPSGTYAPGQTLRVGDTELLVVHTPGHCVDHCCLYLPKYEILIAADIDLTSFGPWYGHPECDLQQLRCSVELVRELKPRLVISAHRPPVKRDLDAAFDSWIAVLDQREARLLEFLTRERTWDEIVSAALIYGRFPYVPEVMRSWEGQMIGKHLAELRERGEVIPTNHGFRRR